MTRNPLKLSCFFLFIFILNTISNCSSESTENVRVFTVATEATDGYQRYLRSAKHYGIEVDTLGFGKEWRGGNMLMTGGGYKINLLREAIEDFKDDNNSIILFTDSYDVVFTSDTSEILKKFKSFDAKIVFGAEHFCWPLAELEKEYPTVPPKESRFLNSGMFIGYARNVYEMLSAPLKDTDDDQLYYTKIFLDADKREHLKIKLDTKSDIFQNLHGAIDDVKLDIHIETGAGTLQNIHFLTAPSLIHGNGPSKISLNAFANYLGGILENKKCKLCEENKIVLEDKKLPIVSVALFAERPVPFYEEFLEKIFALNYPRKRINLFIHSLDKFHDKLSEKFINDFGTEYRSSKLILSTDGIDERQARKLAVHQAEQKKSDYLFSVENDAHIDYGELLRDLVEYNRSFIAPVISKTDDLWSNFWGAITDTEFYARSYDYVDILRGTIRGMWNVPYVANCYLVKREIFKKMNFDYETFDADMSLCHNLRNEGVFMYVVNEKDYGHLINVDDFDHTLTRPDFYTLFSNRIDWEERYIHPEYIRQLQPNFTQNQPCPDVYRFKIGTDQFCEDMIAIMENFGKWSDGSNTDKRLEGGYEAVPTRDIHMNQVGLEKQWLKFLDIYVRPLQEAVFTGYFHNPPRSLMNFVVRYRPDEQPSLRPHHDSSTYTINIALNRAEADYQGGGCHFLRYNCSVTDTKPGWMLMHPGRLTHFHEGLKVTDGTRYIMISFVDP